MEVRHEDKAKHFLQFWFRGRISVLAGIFLETIVFPRRGV